MGGAPCFKPQLWMDNIHSAAVDRWFVPFSVGFHGVLACSENSRQPAAMARILDISMKCLSQKLGDPLNTNLKRVSKKEPPQSPNIKLGRFLQRRRSSFRPGAAWRKSRVVDPCEEIHGSGRVEYGFPSCARFPMSSWGRKSFGLCPM